MPAGRRKQWGTTLAFWSFVGPMALGLLVFTYIPMGWGFILSLTGQSVVNGQWLRCDPTDPAPQQIVWQA